MYLDCHTTKGSRSLIEKNGIKPRGSSSASLVQHYIYSDVPGSPCVSKMGPVYGPSFSIFSSLLVHLLTDQRIPGPVSCH